MTPEIGIMIGIYICFRCIESMCITGSRYSDSTARTIVTVMAVVTFLVAAGVIWALPNGYTMKLPKPQYEIFERLSNGAVLRAVVPGLFETQRTLFELAERTDNECYAIYPQTQEIVARVNSSDA